MAPEMTALFEGPVVGDPGSERDGAVDVTRHRQHLHQIRVVAGGDLGTGRDGVGPPGDDNRLGNLRSQADVEALLLGRRDLHIRPDLGVAGHPELDGVEPRSQELEKIVAVDTCPGRGLTLQGGRVENNRHAGQAILGFRVGGLAGELATRDLR